MPLLNNHHNVNGNDAVYHDNPVNNNNTDNDNHNTENNTNTEDNTENNRVSNDNDNDDNHNTNNNDNDNNNNDNNEKKEGSVESKDEISKWYGMSVLVDAATKEYEGEIAHTTGQNDKKDKIVVVVSTTL